VRISVVLVSLLLAGVGALVWSSSGRAFNPVVPILDCVYRTSTGNLLAVYGYDNQNNQNVTIPVDVVPSNYFSPDPKFRGQPVIFLAGRHDSVFSVEFDGGSTLSWTLLGTTVTASAANVCNNLTYRGDWTDTGSYNPGDAVRYGGGFWVAKASPGTDPPGTGDAWQLIVQGVRVRGDWNSNDTYLPGDVVRLDGSAWVAETTNTNSEPAPASTDWQLLAQGDAHPAFPSTQTHTFGRGNTATIQDPNVTPSSVIIVQYVNGGGAVATSVNNVTNGSFTATGTTGKSFTYVVYN